MYSGWMKIKKLILLTVITLLTAGIFLFFGNNNEVKAEEEDYTELSSETLSEPTAISYESKGWSTTLYKISNQTNFLYFYNTLYRSNSITFKNCTISLETDIDLSGVTIANTGSVRTFAGNFFGNNHTIRGMTYRSKYGYKQGLFDQVEGTVNIKDLVIDSFDLALAMIPKSASYIGGVIGAAYSGKITIDNVTVKNCYLNGTDAGGIFGVCYSNNLSINNCKVMNSEIVGRMAAGGIVASPYTNTVIMNCEVLDSTIRQTEDADVSRVGSDYFASAADYAKEAALTYGSSYPDAVYDHLCQNSSTAVGGICGASEGTQYATVINCNVGSTTGIPYDMILRVNTNYIKLYADKNDPDNYDKYIASSRNNCYVYGLGGKTTTGCYFNGVFEFNGEEGHESQFKWDFIDSNRSGYTVSYCYINYQASTKTYDSFTVNNNYGAASSSVSDAVESINSYTENISDGYVYLKAVSVNGVYRLQPLNISTKFNFPNLSEDLFTLLGTKRLFYYTDAEDISMLFVNPGEDLTITYDKNGEEYLGTGTLDITRMDGYNLYYFAGYNNGNFIYKKFENIDDVYDTSTYPNGLDFHYVSLIGDMTVCETGENGYDITPVEPEEKISFNTYYYVLDYQPVSFDITLDYTYCLYYSGSELYCVGTYRNNEGKTKTVSTITINGVCGDLDLTTYLSLLKGTYKVEWILNDEVYKTEYYAMGDKLTGFPEVPAETYNKNGEKFREWYISGTFDDENYFCTPFDTQCGAGYDEPVHIELVFENANDDTKGLNYRQFKLSKSKEAFTDDTEELYAIGIRLTADEFNSAENAAMLNYWVSEDGSLSTAFYLYLMDSYSGEYRLFDIDSYMKNNTEYDGRGALKNADLVEITIKFCSFTIEKIDEENITEHYASDFKAVYFYKEEVTLHFKPELGYTMVSKVYSVYNNTLSFVASNDEVIYLGTKDITTTVTFYLNGELYTVLSGRYGSPLTMPVLEDMENKVFSGWDKTFETYPETNEIVTGTYYQLTVLDLVISSKHDFGLENIFLSSVYDKLPLEEERFYPVSVGNNANYYNAKDYCFKYYGSEVYLWIYDDILGEFKCMDYVGNLENKGLVYLTFYDINITLSDSHASVTGYGIQAIGYNIKMEVKADTGYHVTADLYNYRLIDGSYSVSRVDYEEQDHQAVACGCLFRGYTNEKQDYISGYDVLVNYTVKRIEYNLSYYINDVCVKTEKHYYKDEITMDYSILEGTGYSGWDTEFDSMPSSNVNVYAALTASYTIEKYPVIGKLHEGQTLAEAKVTQGTFLVDGNTVDGTSVFKHPETVVSKSDSLSTEYEMMFISNDGKYVAYTFTVVVEVCNPVYNGIMQAPHVDLRRATELKISLNSKYEYYFKNAAIEKSKYVYLHGDGELHFMDLTPDTEYELVYRYMADENYCESENYSIIIKTMSLDEELYNDTCEEALEYLDSFSMKIDNLSAGTYITSFKFDFSKTYEEQNSKTAGAEHKKTYDYFKVVFDLSLTIEEKRQGIHTLQDEKMSAYSDKRNAEIYELAFLKNTDVIDLNDYTSYILGVFDTSDELLVNLLINAGYDLNGIKLQADTDSLDTRVAYVNGKVDELLEYDFDDYADISLVEFKTDFVGGVVENTASSIKLVHSCDGTMVTTTVGKKITTLESKTYMDYKFNREEYDKAFYEAAEVAIVCHIQGIVLIHLDDKYQAKNATYSSSKQDELYNIYLSLKDHYSDYDAFYADYEAMVEENPEITYEEVLTSFDNKLDNQVLVPIKSGLSDTEVIVLVFFGVAFAAVLGVSFMVNKLSRRDEFNE